MYDATQIYGLDIETSTSLIVGPDGYDADGRLLPEATADYNPGLDPIRGFITEVVVKGADEHLDLVLSNPASTQSPGHGEVRLLEDLDTHIRHLPPAVIVTWNGGPFDLPFLHTRAQAHRAVGSLRPFGLRLSHADGLAPKYSALPGHGPEFRGLDGRLGHSGVYSATWDDTLREHAHAHLDISYAYKGFAERYGIKHGLKPVAEALGLNPISVDREQMHLLTEAERRAYVLSDGRCTRLLALGTLGLIDLGVAPTPRLAS